MNDWTQAIGRRRGLGGLLLLAACTWPISAAAQLRIVSYNTTGAPRAGMDVVLKAIGEESREGIAKPIDVLLLQEQSHSAGLPDTQAFVNLLNTMYAGQGITYARGNLIGGGDTTQTIVYRTQSVQLLSETTVGTSGDSPLQPRQALRYRVKPAGYDDSAAYYIYNSHYKASDDPTSEARRLVEANAIRANADALPDSSPIIYAGDHNFYRSTDGAFVRLTSAGDAQAIDPINRVGVWHTNASFADTHTQSPVVNAGQFYGGQVGGGMDDRFDFQLVTGELLDGEGLDYIAGSYHAFGNGGNLCCNGNITDANNAVTFPGVTSYTKPQVLNMLAAVTDHLPVVADYQLPAVLQALVSAVPETLYVGEVLNLKVTVSNAADVVAPNGADELDYSITTAYGGAVSGSYFNQMTLALSAGNVHQLALDTSTPGMKSGTVFVQSGSPMAANAQLQFPISYQVLAASLAGDYNSDGTVDAADYVVWRDGFGAIYTQDDYLVWKNHFGQSLGSGGTVGVPEPNTGLLLVVGVCWLAFRPATLRAWNRRK